MALFFVVRKDIADGSGQQRVFDVKDTKEEAFFVLDRLTQHFAGDFGVFGGEEVKRDE